MENARADLPFKIIAALIVKRHGDVPGVAGEHTLRLLVGDQFQLSVSRDRCRAGEREKNQAEATVHVRRAAPRRTTESLSAF